MTVNKTIAFDSDVLDPHIEIPVPIGTTVLTTEYVQDFLRKIQRRLIFVCRKV